jgi:glycosyltransferase involved in cell wall biosynthesis
MVAATSVNAQAPTITVIIPVRNDPYNLQQCLTSLEASRYRNFEVVVVDDASTDQTPEIARHRGVELVRLERQSGPAAARNRGAEVARGEYLLFIDADVCVQPDTVGLFVQTLNQQPDMDAVFGSYDTQPRALNVVSQYRNLMHHFVHQDGSPQASTFWSGCGAIRRKVFLEMGGFNTGYGRPSIEDIELGARLHRAGRRIGLDKRIQVTHLKRWTVWGMVKADVRDRALPWTELILREKSLPNDLNLTVSHRLSCVLAYGLLGSLLAGAWRLHALLLTVPVFLIVAIVLLDYWSLTRRVPTWLRVLAVVGVLAGNAALPFYLRWWALVPLGCLLGVFALNWRFYVFFARERHPLFAALALPLHIFYYIYSGAAFGMAVTLFLWKNLAPRFLRRTEVREPSKKAQPRTASGMGVPPLSGKSAQ